MTRKTKTLSLLSAALLASLLSACGGGNDSAADLQAVNVTVMHCPITSDPANSQSRAAGTLTVTQANSPEGFGVTAAAVAASGAKDEDYVWTWKPSVRASQGGRLISVQDYPSGKDLLHVSHIIGENFVDGDEITVDLHVDRKGHEDPQHGNASCRLSVVAG